MQIAPQVLTEQNKAALLDFVNGENLKYKPFKLYFNANGALLLDLCLTNADDDLRGGQLPSGATLNITSPDEINLNLAAGTFTIDGRKISAATEFEITADKDNIKVPLSEDAVTINGAAITGNGAATIDNTEEFFFSIFLPDGAKVNGSDKAKYQNRQFEINGMVELVGKKFETDQQIRCGLINVQVTIEGTPVTLNGFVVDDNYVQIQDDSYERVKVVDKAIATA